MPAVRARPSCATASCTAVGRGPRHAPSAGGVGRRRRGVLLLAGGVLTGKYDADPEAGRAAGALDQPMYAAAANAARSLAQLADRLGTTPAALAVAFALQHPAVATVLFGATRPAQIQENVAALEVEARLDRCRPRRAHRDRDVSISGRRPGRGSAASP